MKKTIFLLLISATFLSLTAQRSPISIQKAELYEDNNTPEVPNINGFTALDLYHDNLDNTVWVSPEKQCVTMKLNPETSQDGKYSLHLKWDKIEGGCKWIGMGFGWNAWEPKELSLVENDAAIQFYVRSLKDTLKSLPWAIALEDYSGVQAYTGFSTDYLESSIYPSKWTKVTIPISRFPIEAYDLDLSLVKQFMIQFDAQGQVLVDNFTIIPLEKKPIEVLVSPKSTGMNEQVEDIIILILQIC